MAIKNFFSLPPVLGKKFRKWGYLPTTASIYSPDGTYGETYYLSYIFDKAGTEIIRPSLSASYWNEAWSYNGHGLPVGEYGRIKDIAAETFEFYLQTYREQGRSPIRYEHEPAYDL